MIAKLNAQKRAQATLGKPQVRLPKNTHEPPTTPPLIKFTTVTSNEFLILSYPIFTKL